MAIRLRKIGKAAWALLASLLLANSAVAQDTPPLLVPPEREFFVEAVVDNATPYVGERIVYSLRFYARALPEFINLTPDFVGLWRAGQQIYRYPELVEGWQYLVTATDILLYPTRSGPLTIDPATIVIAESVFSDRPRLELRSDPVQLNVVPLPAGAPEGFTGAVGRLDMQVALSAETVRLGEPVTLRQRISGAGNLEQIAPPALRVPDGWRVYPNPSNLTVQPASENIATLVGERTFEWRLIPERSGTQTFPALSFSYFDPVTEQYRTISAEPFTVDVLPGADGLRELPGIARGSALPVLPLKPVPATLTVAETRLPHGYWLLWLLPPLAAGLVAAVLWLRGYRQRARVRRRQVGALRVARKRLEAAAQAGGVKGHSLAYRAIVGYFADKLNRDDLLPYDIMTALPTHGVDGALSEQVRACLDRAEEGRYAPDGLLDVLPLVGQTAQILLEVEQCWVIPVEASQTIAAGKALRAAALLALMMVVSVRTIQPAQAQMTAAEAVSEAERAYNDGDYARAVALYETLLAFDLRSAEIYANLGSAYFQNTDLGRALVNFRRAQALRPRDADIGRGVALVRALRVDIQGDEVALIDAAAIATSSLLTLTELAWLALLGWTLWWGGMLLWLLRPVWRAALRWLLVGYGVAVVTVALLLLVRVYVEDARPQAVVTAFLTPVMSGPGDAYLEIFDLYAAAELRVMEQRNDWVRALLPDGRQGWLPVSALDVVSAPY